MRYVGALTNGGDTPEMKTIRNVVRSGDHQERRRRMNVHTLWKAWGVNRDTWLHSGHRRQCRGGRGSGSRDQPSTHRTGAAPRYQVGKTHALVVVAEGRNTTPPLLPSTSLITTPGSCSSFAL